MGSGVTERDARSNAAGAGIFGIVHARRGLKLLLSGFMENIE